MDSMLSREQKTMTATTGEGLMDPIERIVRERIESAERHWDLSRIDGQDLLEKMRSAELYSLLSDSERRVVDSVSSFSLSEDEVYLIVTIYNGLPIVEPAPTDPGDRPRRAAAQPTFACDFIEPDQIVFEGDPADVVADEVLDEEDSDDVFEDDEDDCEGGDDEEC